MTLKTASGKTVYLAAADLLDLADIGVTPEEYVERLSAGEVRGVLRLDELGAMRRAEAAAYLTISEDTFDREVAPKLAFKRVGALKLFPKFELDRFLAETEASIEEQLKKARRRDR